jgi:tRNA G18 (ribose-2'-O)-methylase SpoU
LSLIRTGEGLGIKTIYLTGYTPYPKLKDDRRLPHEANKIDAQITKTSLGAETMVDLKHSDNIFPVLKECQQKGYRVVALEQNPHATSLIDFRPPGKLVLVVGREVDGIEADVLVACDSIIEIPMLGQKESFNVVQAAAMALYHCRFSL